MLGRRLNPSRSMSVVSPHLIHPDKIVGYFRLTTPMCRSTQSVSRPIPTTVSHILISLVL